MKKKYSTKRALIASVLALCMCFSMLVGTTFAWFTDSVTSANNIIQTGNLDVEMYWLEGDENPAATSGWNTADQAIFNNDKWEPGYSEAKHIKIANEGTLALKYQMRIIATGVVSELADVIDVYHFDTAKQLTRADFVEANKIGTLKEVLNSANANFISKVVSGDLTAGETDTITLALKMQESAGNEYQNLALGSEFAIQILATQLTSEEDSFDNQYDKDADFAPQEIPAANVYAFSKSAAQSITLGTLSGTNYVPNGIVGLDTAYSFQPTETYEQSLESEYSWAHVDFFVYADRTVPANSMMLAGYYSAFGDYLHIDNTQWIGLSSDTDIKGGIDNGVRLLRDGMDGITVAYNEICNYGNNGEGFLCGAADLTGENAGNTLTVELRAYEVGKCGDTSTGHHHNSLDCETGEYKVIGTFTYTFGGEYVTLDDGAEVFMGEDGDVWLSDVSGVTVDKYFIPDGVNVLNGGVFATNPDIKSVVLSDTITDFGATGVSETGASGGAFKGSAVEEVVLPDGMTEIPAAVFNGAKSLTSVNIPSTVDTVGVNAFRQTAITELDVPATVKNVSTGAFRDMSALTTVTVEGNVAFKNYAFRSCPNLENIYLLGDDVTFSGTQFACHSDNGNAEGITIYVQNATVAARVYAAQASTYGYKVKVLGDADDGSDATDAVHAKSNAELGTAIENGASTIVLGAGTYNVPSALQNKEITIAGTAATKIDVTNGLNYINGSKITFDGVTIQSKAGTGYDYGFADAKYGVFNNCVIEGSIGLDYSCEFNNCTFNVSGNAYNVWTWGAGTATFNGCTFNCDGKAMLVYANVLDNGTAHQTVNINGCKFYDKGDDTVTGKAAIEITNTYNNPIRTYDVIINDITVEGFSQTVPGAGDFNAAYGSVAGSNIGTNVWGNKCELPNTQINVEIDGVDVY